MCKLAWELFNVHVCFRGVRFAVERLRGLEAQLRATASDAADALRARLHASLVCVPTEANAAASADTAVSQGDSELVSWGVTVLMDALAATVGDCVALVAARGGEVLAAAVAASLRVMHACSDVASAAAAEDSWRPAAEVVAALGASLQQCMAVVEAVSTAFGLTSAYARDHLPLLQARVRDLQAALHAALTAEKQAVELAAATAACVVEAVQRALAWCEAHGLSLLGPDASEPLPVETPLVAAAIVALSEVPALFLPTACARAVGVLAAVH